VTRAGLYYFSEARVLVGAFAFHDRRIFEVLEALARIGAVVTACLHGGKQGVLIRQLPAGEILYVESLADLFKGQHLGRCVVRWHLFGGRWL